MKKQKKEPDITIEVERTKIAGEPFEDSFVWVPKTSTVVEVEFNDGTRRKYAGDRTLSTGDAFVVGPGCKSSYAIGKVVSVASTQGGTSHMAGPVMTFRKNPTKSELKKCAGAYTTIKAKKDLDPFLPYGGSMAEYGYGFGTASDFVLSDVYVHSIISALTALSFPALVSADMVEEAKQYLSKPKSVPLFMFSSSMNKMFGDEIVLMGFSGYYPEWKNQLKAQAIWSNEAVIAANDGIVEPDGHCLFEEGGLLVYGFEGGNEVKDAFKSDAGFNAFFNKLVYLSAFAVMIRGNLMNLLKTALTVKMPIKEFYSEIIDLAQAFNATDCYEQLKGTDYTNLSFKESTGAAKAKKTK